MLPPLLRRLAASLAVCLLPIASAVAGTYSGPTDTASLIDPAIPADSPRFVAWANSIQPLGSGTYFAPRGSTAVSTTGFNSLGDLSAAEIAAGASPGRLTVGFPVSIRNGPGPDFAAFENGFVFPDDPYLFMDLAYVEVSTNGTNFARFPNVSTNTTYAGTFGPAFAGYDSTNIRNLAGKHADGFGTPFDLDDLLTNPLVTQGTVDLANIRYVRLVDIPGSGAFLDTLGNPILDNWLGSGTTGGYDFRLPAGQGIGVLNAVVPEPTNAALLAIPALLLRRRRGSTKLATGKTAALLAALTLPVTAHAVTIDFDELNPAARPAFGPANPGFVSRGVTFAGGSFSGFTYSNVNNPTTPGFSNQYAAITGRDVSGHGNYALLYDTASLTLPPGTRPASVFVTNTTYAALSMARGDAFAKKFGGPTGYDPDLFSLTFTGRSAAGFLTGTVTVRLADFTPADNRLDTILTTWKPVDLTPLGLARNITLSFASTDTGLYGINTPVYAAIDNLVLTPVPPGRPKSGGSRVVQTLDNLRSVPEPSAAGFAIALAPLLARR